MQPQRTVNIKDKFKELNIDVNELSLGEFDQIAEITARKARDPNSELFKRVGCYFKPNLERGLLIYSLIKKYRLTSYLEIGWGRGYSSICAARAFSELGNDGHVMVIEPTLDDQFMNAISQMFPQEWLSHIKFAKGTSAQILPKLKDKYDFIYVDGDHTKESVIHDYGYVSELWNDFLLMDDYHMQTDTDPNIQVHEALQQFEHPSDASSDLVIMDRRIFPDDRGWTDDMIKYGQLLFTKNDTKNKQTATVTWEW